jgi:hypothetical protein
MLFVEEAVFPPPHLLLEPSKSRQPPHFLPLKKLAGALKLLQLEAIPFVEEVVFPASHLPEP